MNSAGYGGSAPQGYEAPACVQNAMGTKDKKPFTYTPGGLDLSQIKSERMAKRLARNAQAEGAAGLSQQHRPQQPQSPGSCSAAQQIGAAGMGMPFQVLPPPPPGKQLNGTTAGPPPPPPPSSSSTLAPPQKCNNGTGSAPGSPNMQRKSLTPQRFEPPPMGFRPEIKIPPNPMAALRKVPPPVEKNTFWKDEYVRDRSKSPLVGENDRASSPCTKVVSESANSAPTNTVAQDEPAAVSLNNNNSNNVDKNNGNEEVDGYKKPSRYIQQPDRSNTSTPQSQQSTQSSQQLPAASNINTQSSLPVSTPPLQQQQQQSPPSVTPSQSPVTNVLARQTDSPRSDTSTPSQRGAESPFRYGGQQQQQAQQRPASAMSPLARAQSPKPPSPKPTTSPSAPTAASPQTTSTSNSPNSQPQAQAVPWRTQRTPATTQQQQQQPQSTPLYNNVTVQPPTPTQQAPAYQGPKPTNVGSLYIAPLAQPTEPQAPSVVRQFQQQQQQRESPIRQLPQQQPPQQQSQPLRTNVPWLSGKPKVNDQPEWCRPEENGNVVPSSLNRIKSPPPTAVAQQSPQSSPAQQYQPQPYHQPQQQQQIYQQQTPQPYQQQQPQPYQQQQPQPYQQQQQPYYQQQQQPPQQQFYSYQPEQGNNGFAAAAPANFGSHGAHGPSGLRLQINLNTNTNSGASQQTGPRERIIPIQLEQTPTSAPAQAPNFNVSYGGMTTAPSSYVLRSPNQFVDQGYNNYPSSAGIQQPSAAVNAQRVMSPTQQLNAPRIVQQQQQYGSNNVGAAGNRSRIIPISMESGSDGTRGPISSSPIVLQNDNYNLVVYDCPLEAEIRYRKNRLSDPRSSPIQSKSFRILQKITDTIDNGNGNNDKQTDSYAEPEPQLQRPQYARQMSAQQARQQPNVEQQMRRMHITPEAQQQQSQTPQAWNQDMPQSYIHPSEQQVPEPKKYTGSAIPSRSFKILQAMTTPENAGPGQSDL